MGKKWLNIVYKEKNSTRLKKHYREWADGYDSDLKDWGYAYPSKVKQILENCYKTAKEVLETNIDALHKMSQALMDYETLDVDQIDDIMAGGDPRAPKSSKEPPTKDSKETSVGDAAEQS